MNNVKCKNCGYEWTTKSKLKRVSCPSCLLKIENIGVENVDKNL